MKRILIILAVILTFAGILHLTFETDIEVITAPEFSTELDSICYTEIQKIASEYTAEELSNMDNDSLSEIVINRLNKKTSAQFTVSSVSIQAVD